MPYRLTAFCMMFVLATAISNTAMAAEPRPGLWDTTVTTDMSQMAMPEVPAMPPEVMAQMQAMGIEIPNMDFSQPRVTNDQSCITPEDIANREPFSIDNEMDDDCRQENLVVNDDGMSVDMICTGDMNGTGRLEYVFESDVRYTGSMTFNGAMDGRPANMSTSMEGNWISGDCGAVAP